MNIEGNGDKVSHKIVTRPYSLERYSDPNGVLLSTKPLIEIDIKRAEILDQMNNFIIDKKTTPTSLITEIMNSYGEKFGKSIEKPDVFIHLTQEENLEVLAPKLQIYVSDIVLGNLNRDGFYRTIIEGKNQDLKRSKKYLSEILRFYWADVVDIKGIYFGYRVDPH
jgi:hypothetical protein